MNAIYREIVLIFEASFCLVTNDLMNRMLTQTIIIVENGLVMNLRIVLKMISCSTTVWDMIATIRSLRTNIPEATTNIHFMYGEDLRYSVCASFWLNIFVVPSMHHPRISVVMIVERQCTAYGDAM